MLKWLARQLIRFWNRVHFSNDILHCRTATIVDIIDNVDIKNVTNIFVVE